MLKTLYIILCILMCYYNVNNIQISKNLYQKNNDDFYKLSYLSKIFYNGNKELYPTGTFDNQETYEQYKYELILLIYRNFTYKQIQSISKISLINLSELDTNVIGITHTYGYNNSSSIEIAISDKNDIKNVLLHEIFHAIYYRYYDYFESHLAFKWLSINQHVSLYSQISLEEDVAETGSYYIRGDTIVPNLKFKLIHDFLLYTK